MTCSYTSKVKTFSKLAQFCYWQVLWAIHYVLSDSNPAEPLLIQHQGRPDEVIIPLTGLEQIELSLACSLHPNVTLCQQIAGVANIMSCTVYKSMPCLSLSSGCIVVVTRSYIVCLFLYYVAQEQVQILHKIPPSCSNMVPILWKLTVSIMLTVNKDCKSWHQLEILDIILNGVSGYFKHTN